MLAAGYTLLHDGHVRVDVFYRPASERFKAWVNLIGVLVLLLPTVGVVLYYTIPYVQASWLRLEMSREAGGLPGLFLYKTIIPSLLHPDRPAGPRHGRPQHPRAARLSRLLGRGEHP
jgi:TRAP-type mannitol/chloroaromatic compound transport system permease small subunit